MASIRMFRSGETFLFIVDGVDDEEVKGCVFVCGHLEGMPRYLSHHDPMILWYMQMISGKRVLFVESIRDKIAKLNIVSIMCGMEHISFLLGLGIDLSHVSNLDLYLGPSIRDYQLMDQFFDNKPLCDVQGQPYRVGNSEHHYKADVKTHLDTGDFMLWMNAFKTKFKQLEIVSLSYNGLPVISPLVWTLLTDQDKYFASVSTLKLGNGLGIEQDTLDNWGNPGMCLKTFQQCQLLQNDRFPLRKKNNYKQLMCAYACYKNMGSSISKIDNSVWRQFTKTIEVGETNVSITTLEQAIRVLSSDQDETIVHLICCHSSLYKDGLQYLHLFDLDLIAKQIFNEE